MNLDPDLGQDDLCGMRYLMFTLLISLLSAALTFGLVTYLFSWLAALLPALIVFGVVFFLISRNIQKQVEGPLMGMQKLLQQKQFNKSVEILLSISNRWHRWQFFLQSIIYGQIGSIYYLQQDWENAKKYLQKGFIRHWNVQAMLALIYYRNKQYKKMDEVFKAACKYNKKQGLLWTLWAFCHQRMGDSQRALNILLEAKGHLKDSDPYLNANLLSLQNEKKLKMRPYGEQWYQFLLERPPQVKMQSRSQVRFG